MMTLKETHVSEDLLAQWRAIFAHNKACVLIINDQGTVLFANDTFKSLLINSVDIWPTSLGDIFKIDEADHALFHVFLQRAASGGGVLTFQKNLSTVDSLEYTVTRLPNTDAMLVWFRTNEPNSALNRENVALRSELGHIISTLRFGYMRTTLAGDILKLNQWVTTSLIPPVGPSPQSCLPFFSNEDDFAKIASQAVENRIYSATDIELEQPNARPLFADITCFLIEKEGHKHVLNWLIIDQTEHHSVLEDLRHKNEELSKMHNQMEKFLYSTSHDFRAPLTTVMGLVNLMRLDFKAEGLSQYLDKVDATMKNLDSLLRDTIDFSKTTYQRITSDRIVFDELVWQIIAERRKPEDMHINFDLKIADSRTFYSDPSRMYIIFSHLINNALHFCDTSKRFSFIKIEVNTMPERVEVRISDNGIGIGKPHLDKVFNMYYKASERSRGAGLGLYIVRENVSQLGGSIAIDAEIGFGTTVTISIPNGPKGKLMAKKMALRCAGR
jgi:signal transduction histidine kinase